MEGYAAVGQMLLYDLKTAGVRIVTSADAFPELGDAQGDDEVFRSLLFTVYADLYFFTMPYYSLTGVGS